jgi:hypothetical protein
MGSCAIMSPEQHSDRKANDFWCREATLESSRGLLSPGSESQTRSHREATVESNSQIRLLFLIQSSLRDEIK